MEYSSPVHSIFIKGIKVSYTKFNEGHFMGVDTLRIVGGGGIQNCAQSGRKFSTLLYQRGRKHRNSEVVYRHADKLRPILVAF